ncbi:MAG: heavy metal translocating P-type ATPase [Oscillospiraceae bacterium]
MISFFKNEQKRTVLLLSLSLVSLVAAFFAGSLPVNPAWVAIVLCGLPIVKNAVVGLVMRFDIKADVLVAIALVASVVIAEYFAAGEIAFIMALGAFLEERTVRKARAGIENLVKLTPTTARVVRGGAETIVPASQVQAGEILRVLAGETIAADGVITAGNTSINQAVMTGEPLPVDKAEGDEVFSGTTNQFGTFDMVAQKVGEESSIRRMVKLVESADAGKAKIVGIADRWATWIVLAALLAAFGTWLFTGQVIRAVTVLVVFCPCALVLATPTAIMAGIGNAAKQGILVRQGDALERLAAAKVVAFDKTGTLTFGRPAVEEVHALAPLTPPQLLALAAAAELRSEHPLGKAIVAHHKAQTGAAPAQPAAFALLPGKGVQAVVESQTLLAGSPALLAENGIALPAALQQAAEARRAEGCTVIYIAANGAALGFIALADTLRPDAPKTVQALHTAGLQTLLLTGDGPEAARHMAAAAGIERVVAGCLPETKLAAIQKMQSEQQFVCMVGDGINDAPALKAAQVGVAMGGIGSDLAIEAADIALIGDDIRQLPHLMGLAKKTMGTIHGNMAASLLLNFVAIALAIAGVLNPVLGALVHNAGSVAVIVHSSMLLKWRKK